MSHIGFDPNSLLIGIDIGGTNIVAAALQSDGDVIARTGGPTLAERGFEDGIARILAMVHEVQQQAGGKPIAGIGIGSTGPLDRIAGRIQNPFTLPTWDDVPIVDRLSEALHVPVILENDAHAAALGEYWRGAGRGAQHMIYITVGTGVGGGIITDGKLLTGAKGLAGEVGHQVIDPAGPECYCGQRGCVERFASAPAMIRLAQDHPDLPHSLMLQLASGDAKAITPALIADAVRQGDAAAQAILERAASALGTALSNLIVTLAPERIVLGGGVMRSFDLFSPTLEQLIARLQGYVPLPSIVPAALGLNAGVTGAVRALLDRTMLSQ